MIIALLLLAALVLPSGVCAAAPVDLRLLYASGIAAEIEPCG